MRSPAGGAVFGGALVWVAATLGAVALGEAAALLFGTTLRRGGPVPWATPAHVAFLVSDIVLGALLLWYGIVPGAPGAVPVLVVTLAALIGTHAWRAWEYLAKRPDPFCANRQLFMVDAGKLALAVLVAAGWLLQR